jgi:putative endonuclease
MPLHVYRKVPLLRSFGPQVRDDTIFAKSRNGKSTINVVTHGTDSIPANVQYAYVEKTYYVYILSSQRRVLYIGITSNIECRVGQHKSHTFGGFTAKYNVTDLVYFERYSSVGKGIRREKELKGWRREKKIALIEVDNLKWRDLSYGWYQPTRLIPLRKTS